MPCLVPALNTFPNTTSSILVGSILLSFITASITAVASTEAGTSLRVPKNEPTAVRRAAVMYTLFINFSFWFNYYLSCGKNNPSL